MTLSVPMQFEQLATSANETENVIEMDNLDEGLITCPDENFQCKNGDWNIQCREHYVIRGSITVRLTSCLFCLDSADLLMLLYLFGQIQTGQTWGLHPLYCTRDLIRRKPPTGQSCCETSSGFGCCPTENAICCGDGLHCCPQGSTCDITTATCIWPQVRASHSIHGNSKVLGSIQMCYRLALGFLGKGLILSEQQQLWFGLRVVRGEHQLSIETWI